MHNAPKTAGPPLFYHPLQNILAVVASLHDKKIADNFDGFRKRLWRVASTTGA